MANTIQTIFDHHFSRVQFNHSLALALYRFQIGFVNKNHEHMAFFGGNLTGVQVVRFSDKDFKVFFDDILKVDRDSLETQIKTIDAIDENWKIAGDLFNLTCMYLIHRFLISDRLSNNQRKQAVMDVGLLFNYRCISALLAHYFRYPTDRKTAEATYAALSQRFLIKKLGNWQEVMAYRAASLVEEESIHLKTLTAFDNDTLIVYAISDSQGRVRSLMKYIYREFIKVHESGEKFTSVSGAGVDIDGTEIIKDRIHGLENYTNYVLTTLSDRNSFVKEDLVDLISKMIHTVQRKHLVTALEWLSDNRLSHHNKEIEELVRLVMVHSYHYLLNNSTVLKDSRDISSILIKLRGIYISSRSNDPELLTLRDVGNNLVVKAVGKVNEQMVASIRTSMFLYICLRAYTKHHYTTGS